MLRNLRSVRSVLQTKHTGNVPHVQRSGWAWHGLLEMVRQKMNPPRFVALIITDILAGQWIMHDTEFPIHVPREGQPHRYAICAGGNWPTIEIVVDGEGAGKILWELSMQ